MIDGVSMEQLVDAAIAFTLLEGLLLVAYHRATGRGLAPREFAVNMAAGLCLMLALRCLARDAGMAWTVLFLLGSGVAHGTDIWLRFRGRAPQPREVTA